MGDWQALVERLMRERGSRLTAYAAMLVGRDGDAEDLLHDAIVKVFSRGRTLSDLDHAEAYVRRTMPTLAIDRARRRGAKDRAIVRSFERDAASPDLEAGLDVRRALRTLSPREQACLVMRYYDDLTVPQIADALHLAQGSVKRYLHDGTARLAPLLGVEDPGPEPEVVELTTPRRRR
ncbi:sigma-70 family RNA polymerase sigma factor [Demequina zhanjiangensis]|uniref:Sigma-70 family RNA polymerase sigma factor n=1 Tax=Demequina zhanjiangensis TaxID=3051659 RepID=A0ABT8FWZ8_9MICO|nr:sigma-70 family RNA polymerase sigma factor [Demequina sp. SYSU T00b26]MDN4471418.1 sigma-70 family RNA polymerase sigma factor [Demequina sp. SYSU T00b26]